MQVRHRSNLFTAGVWIAVWAACWPVGSLFNGFSPNLLALLLLFVWWFVFFGGLFAAAGALFGRADIGFMVGALVGLVFLFLTLL